MGLESVFVQEDKRKHLFYKFDILGEKMKVILIVHDDDDDLHHVGQMKRWRRELSHIRRKKTLSTAT